MAWAKYIFKDKPMLQGVVSHHFDAQIYFFMSRRNTTFWSKVGETEVGEMGVAEQGPIQQYFMQPFLRSMKLLKGYTHALTKHHTEVTS